MYPAVTSVTAQDDYVLAVEFDHGEFRRLDMKPYLDFADRGDSRKHKSGER